MVVDPNASIQAPDLGKIALSRPGLPPDSQYRTTECGNAGYMGESWPTQTVGNVEVRHGLCRQDMRTRADMENKRGDIPKHAGRIIRLDRSVWVIVVVGLRSLFSCVRKERIRAIDPSPNDVKRDRAQPIVTNPAQRVVLIKTMDREVTDGTEFGLRGSGERVGYGDCDVRWVVTGVHGNPTVVEVIFMGNGGLEKEDKGDN